MHSDPWSILTTQPLIHITPIPHTFRVDRCALHEVFYLNDHLPHITMGTCIHNNETLAPICHPSNIILLSDSPIQNISSVMNLATFYVHMLDVHAGYVATSLLSR